MKRLLPIVLLFTTACAQSGLPPIDAEIPMSMVAINVPMQLRTNLVTVDFRGTIKQRVDVNPDDPNNSRRLRIDGFRMTADLPDNGGTLTIEQNDVDVDVKSLLKLTQNSPPRYEHINLLSFTLTIDQPERGESLVLTTKDPMMLIGKPTQFPPRGELYQQQNPVDLVLPEDPDTTIATIQRFPVKIGGM